MVHKSAKPNDKNLAFDLYFGKWKIQTQGKFEQKLEAKQGVVVP